MIVPARVYKFTAIICYIAAEESLACKFQLGHAHVKRHGLCFFVSLSWIRTSAHSGYGLHYVSYVCVIFTRYESLTGGSRLARRRLSLVTDSSVYSVTSCHSADDGKFIIVAQYSVAYHRVTVAYLCSSMVDKTPRPCYFLINFNL